VAATTNVLRGTMRPDEGRIVAGTVTGNDGRQEN
jgi:hypothetical protein